MIAQPTRFRFALIVACSAIVAANGCTPRHDVPEGRLSPAQYCPGDTLTFGYDLEQSQTCVRGADGRTCAEIAPTYTIAGDSAAFGTVSPVTALRFSRDFAPSEPRVSVSLTPDREWFHYIAIDGGGEHVVERWLRPETHSADRIDGETSVVLQHGGTCDGGGGHLPSAIPGPRLLSPRLRAQRVCNRSDVRVNMILTADDGTVVSGDLIPGGCLATSSPGMPAGGRVVTVAVRALSVDPMAHCDGSVQSAIPPRPLRTEAFLACGN